MAEGKVQQKIVHTTYPTPKVSTKVAIQYMYYIHTNTVEACLGCTPQIAVTMSMNTVWEVLQKCLSTVHVENVSGIIQSLWLLI